ncbi:hypothetical protein D3C81_442060 [compost metagenome]
MTDHLLEKAPRPIDLYGPTFWPAELVAPPTHLVCGACGFNGTVTHYIYSKGSDPYEAVCNCPIEAILRA